MLHLRNPFLEVKDRSIYVRGVNRPHPVHLFEVIERLPEVINIRHIRLLNELPKVFHFLNIEPGPIPVPLDKLLPRVDDPYPIH